MKAKSRTTTWFCSATSHPAKIFLTRSTMTSDKTEKWEDGNNEYPDDRLKSRLESRTDSPPVAAHHGLHRIASVLQRTLRQLRQSKSSVPSFAFA